MILESFQDRELAHVSYIVGCETTGEVALVDPSRVIGPYIEYIRKNRLRLRYILNTHPHADFVSGHKLIGDRLGAENVYHHSVPAAFPFQAVTEGDVLQLGESMQISVLETPGHTPFCVSFLAVEDGIDKLLFSGDFLFSGGLGRPDLLGETTKQALLEDSYASCRKLGSLADHIIVCPSHSGGTMCGKDLKNSFLTTLGIEKQANRAFALALEDRERFIAYLDGQKIDTPAHFKKMGAINLQGAGDIPAARDIPIYTLQEAYKSGRQIVDFRDIYAFMARHAAGSINIAHTANVALIAGSVLSQEDAYILLLPATDSPVSALQRMIKKLGSVGIDRIDGVVYDEIYRVRGGEVPLSGVRTVSLDEVKNDGAFTVIALGNVKLEGVETEHVELSAIGEYDFRPDRRYTFVCTNSFKSMTAVSLLQERENIFFLQ